jgi:hypothetical protein
MAYGWRNSILWVTLIVALAALAWMAFRLTRALKVTR